MNITATRKLEMDAGHRLMGHEGKCRHPHGHRYVFELEVYGLDRPLDGIGRVLDFSKIKEVVGVWLDDTFDHGFIVEDGDPLTAPMVEGGGKVVVLDCSPTIENLVKVVYDNARRLLAPYGIGVRKVRGYETPNCWADYTEDESD